MPNFLPVHWSADRRETDAFIEKLNTFLKKRYNIQDTNFYNLMRLTSATIAGSTPLQVLLDEIWPLSDLDIYVSNDEEASLWHGYLMSAGYKVSDSKPLRETYQEFIDTTRLGRAIESITNYDSSDNFPISHEIVQVIKGNKEKVLNSVDLGLATLRVSVKADGNWQITCHQNIQLLKKKVSYYLQPIDSLTEKELTSRREKYERYRGFTILLKQPEFVDVSAIMDARAAQEAITAIEAAAPPPPPPFVEPSPQMPSPLRIRTPGVSPIPRHVNALSPSLQMQVRGDSQMAVSPSAFRPPAGPPAGPQQTLGQLLADISQIPHADTENIFVTIPPMPTHHPKLRRCKAYSGAEDEASPVARNTSDLEIQPSEVPTSIPRIHIVRSSNTLASHVTELSEA